MEMIGEEDERGFEKREMGVNGVRETRERTFDRIEIVVVAIFIEIGERSIT